jgi:hypothetical protein
MTVSRARRTATFAVLAAIVGVFLGMQETAHTAGTLTLKLEAVGGGTLTVVDDGFGDANPTAGVVTFVGTFDVFEVTVSATSKPALGDPTTAVLGVSGVASAGATPGVLIVSVTDTGFPGPASGDTTMISAVGGTAFSRPMTFQSYLDADNAAFGIAGASVCTPGQQGPFFGAFDNVESATCSLSGAFSLTSVGRIEVAARQVQSYGLSITVGVPGEFIGCRFTGGGVDTDGNWDHTLESGEMVRNGVGKLPAGIDRYQFGGQVGARTAAQPQPSGEWQHHQQVGPSGSFSFHGGTHSAAPGTRIVDVRCSDPGHCEPARKAPAKQLDFDGIGTFSNLGKGKNAPVFESPGNVIAEPSGKKGSPFTFHWFEVNIDDLGEPGRAIGAPDPVMCPGRGFGEKSVGPFPVPGGPPLPLAPLANCDCPDFYRITIYKGVLSTDVTLLPDGRVDPNSLDRSNVIYQAFGYIDGGNLQIHPPTGFDTP